MLLAIKQKKWACLMRGFSKPNQLLVEMVVVNSHIQACIFNITVPAVTTPPHEGGDCAPGWESYGSNCYWFMPDDHLTWNTAQVGSNVPFYKNQQHEYFKRLSVYQHIPFEHQNLYF